MIRGGLQPNKPLSKGLVKILQGLLFVVCSSLDPFHTKKKRYEFLYVFSLWCWTTSMVRPIAAIIFLLEDICTTVSDTWKCGSWSFIFTHPPEDSKQTTLHKKWSRGEWTLTSIPQLSEALYGGKCRCIRPPYPISGIKTAKCLLFYHVRKEKLKKGVPTPRRGKKTSQDRESGKRSIFHEIIARHHV